jgi:dTDP-4-dehydrorhamnose 3,5-epimerase
MKFNPTPLSSAFTIDLEKREDDRGFFARFFCVNEYDNNNADRNIVQINNSLSKDKGTLRGIHYQLAPKAESKIVRCIKGSLFDVIVDLRVDSPTFLKWFGAVLSAENRTMMLVPKGFGHAFLTLEENTEALYLVTEFYSPENERGLRWNDPKIGIEWPIKPEVISEKDLNHPDFNLQYHCNL